MNNSIMIAYLPTNTDWCKQDLPHMTLVYCGTTDQMKPGDQNALMKDALSAGAITSAFASIVTGLDTFGEGGDKVDVLTLYPSPELLRARQLVERWNASQFKDFAPHATIGPEGSFSGTFPTVLYFDRIMVGWGDQQTIFPLNY